VQEFDVALIALSCSAAITGRVDLRRALRRAAVVMAAFLSLAATPAHAQRDEGARERTPISLTEAREAALRQGPDVTLARGRQEIARTQVDVAGALANPTVTVTTARETARLGTGLSLPVPLFGQRATAVSAARADADAAGLEVEAVRQEARWNATLAWLDLWEAEERARLLAAAATDTERVATIADEKFKAGSAPRVEVLRTAADRERARADAAFAAASVPAAAARLTIAIGGAGADGSAWTASGKPELALADTGLATLQRGVADHPIVRWERARIAAGAARVRAEQRARWPIVTADVTVNWRDPTLPATDVIGGLSLEAPVLSLRRGAIARAQAEQRLAQTTADLEQRRLAASLADALGRASGAGERARTLASSVLPALEEAWRMYEEGYRDGRVDLLRLLDAQRVRLDTRIAVVEAEAAWERALADVERASGVSLTSVGGRGP
jgi:cobalt-zinc-cadmium efflux system outer membrane protein